MSGSVCARARRLVRAIILDAGGVILHPNLDWLAARAAERSHSAPVDRLLEAYYRTIHALDVDESIARRGAAFTDLDIRRWFFATMLRHVGLPRDEAAHVGDLIAEEAQRAYPRESDIYHWAMPGIRPRLERLRDAGFQLGVASNNDDALEAQLEAVGVIDLFGALKDSGREGVHKPDPELLLRAARDLGVPPVHCLYVGDVDRIDGVAARAAGMAFALLDPLAQPRPSRPLCIPALDAILDHFAATLGAGEPRGGAG